MRLGGGSSPVLPASGMRLDLLSHVPQLSSLSSASHVGVAGAEVPCALGVAGASSCGVTGATHARTGFFFVGAVDALRCGGPLALLLLGAADVAALLAAELLRSGGRVALFLLSAKRATSLKDCICSAYDMSFLILFICSGVISIAFLILASFSFSTSHLCFEASDKK